MWVDLLLFRNRYVLFECADAPDFQNKISYRNAHILTAVVWRDGYPVGIVGRKLVDSVHRKWVQDSFRCLQREGVEVEDI